jgi:hypothetical protein
LGKVQEEWAMMGGGCTKVCEGEVVKPFQQFYASIRGYSAGQDGLSNKKGMRRKREKLRSWMMMAVWGYLSGVNA